MPELNIWVNLKRSLFAVWQEYQGLGLVGGMAHATDLIRQLILLPFTLILPTNLIRYLWHFAMIFLGTFGVYFSLKNTLKFKPWIAFLASLFYLLNFGSVQNFWNPLETFSAFWGFFPWLIFSLWNYLQNQTKANLKKLIIINILAIPGFYVQTLFIVYLLCIFLIFLSWLIYQISARNHNAKSIVCLSASGGSTANLIFNQSKILLLIFLINSFWLLPQFYFLSGNLKNPVQGIGNFMSNDETFARNLNRGYLSDFLILRGYYYDFPDTGGAMMAPWVSHFSNQYILIAGYLLSFFVIIGLVYLCKNIKNSFHLSLILFFLLSCVALLSAIPPFNLINQLFRQIPIINQIFRSPWTKFVTPAIFTFTLLTAYGLQALISLASKIKYSRASFSVLLFTIYFSLIIIFSFPSFIGNYISPKMRLKIPADYFQTFAFFKTLNPSGRIANLPQGSFWGWTNYTWNYSGSGFLWYGIQNPILDRAFDAWNLQNEQYYWQLTSALRGKNPFALEQILNQYNIQYLLFDHSIYYPDDHVFSKTSLSTLQLLNQIPHLKKLRDIGKITVFEYQNPTSPYLITNPVTIKPFGFTFSDPAFTRFGDYLTSNTSDITFPFADLFSNRLQSEISFSISYDRDSVILKNHGVATSFPINYSADKNFSFSPLIYPAQILITDESGSYYRFTSKHNADLFAVNFPDAKLSESYLARVEYRHLSGLPLEISLVSGNSQNKYLNTHLDTISAWTAAWFIIPASQTADFDSGLNFIFRNASLNSLTTQNDLRSVTLYPFPYTTLINQTNSSSTPKPLNRQYLNSQNHLFWYQIPIDSTQPNSYLVLPQSFSPGWLAFSNGHLLPHVLVNNWANTWNISNISNQTVYILFWPQLLQFLGFGLLIGTLIYIARHK